MAGRKVDTIVFDWETPVSYQKLSSEKFEITTAIKDKLVVDCLDNLPHPRFVVKKTHNKWYCLNDDGQVSEEWRRYIERRTNPDT